MKFWRRYWMKNTFTLVTSRSIAANVLSKFSQQNGQYLVLALGARVINALAMFIAIRRFEPTAFGEMSYLQATAVSAVAFTSFGIDVSINAQLTRKRSENSDLGPTMLAAIVIAAGGILLACIVIGTLFSTQLDIAAGRGMATLALCLYASFMILMSLLNATYFALQRSLYVGLAYILNTLTFLALAVFARHAASGVTLLMYSAFAQFVAVVLLISLLIKFVHLNGEVDVIDYFVRSFPKAIAEVDILFRYGVKQIVIISTVMFSQWLIQRKIIFSEGGAAANAVYSIGNQIFNILFFYPQYLPL